MGRDRLGEHASSPPAPKQQRLLRAGPERAVRARIPESATPQNPAHSLASRESSDVSSQSRAGLQPPEAGAPTTSPSMHRGQEMRICTNPRFANYWSELGINPVVRQDLRLNASMKQHILGYYLPFVLVCHFQ